MTLRSTCVNPANFELHPEAVDRVDHHIDISVSDVRQLFEAEFLVSGGGILSASVIHFTDDNRQREGVQLSPVDDDALKKEIREGQEQEAIILRIREEARRRINGGR